MALRLSAYRREVLSLLHKGGNFAPLQKLVPSLNIQQGTPLDTFISKVEDAGVASVDLPLFHKSTLIPRGNALDHNYLRWDLSETAIQSLADEIISFSTAVQNKVVSTPKGERNIQNVLEPLAELEKNIASLVSCCDFIHHVHPDEAMRKISVETDKRISAFFVDSEFRRDIYEAVSEVNESVDHAQLSAEQSRLLRFWLRDFKRNGLHLSQSERDRIQSIQKEMMELGIKFSSNLAEDSSLIEFSEAELEGLPSDFLEKKERNGDKVILTMTYPDVFPTLKLAKNPETRRKVEQMFGSLCKDVNAEILERLVQLRDEQAHILGFPNHASYILDIRMAKSPEKVQDFLDDLSAKLSPLLEYELNALLSLKEKECNQLGIEFDNAIHMWDYRYYMNMREETEFQVDHQKIKEYFPIDVVTKGLLGIYQELLSLRFEQVPAETWHPDVQHFLVSDEQGNHVGAFYLDLFPRTGKYSHAACFGIQCQAQDQYPVAAVVANFSKPGPSSPALLLHSEVVTFFHEFGHVMHQICSKVQYARFAGTRVERDFVEAPSQMLENWCWEKQALVRMSSHFQTGEVLPEKLLERLVAGKNSHAGLANLRQILFGKFDQTIHSQASVDSGKLFNDMQKEIMKIPASQGTNFAASFGHLAGGYDASYYGYMWSEVFSADMFESVFKSAGLMDQNAGRRYRTEILEAGGSRDAQESLERFLGRPPNSDAFLKSKGLSM